MNKEIIIEHFQNRWADFYGRLVDLPAHANGSVKICSPLRRDDKNPSFQINFEGEFAGRWRDYGSDLHGDAIDFYQRLRGTQNFNETVEKIAQEFGLQAVKESEGPKRIKTLAERGISEATAKAFQIIEGKGNAKVTHRITFPIFDREGKRIGEKTHKAGQTKGNTAQLYPWKALSNETVYLANGEPSVWRAWESGHRNVICGTGGEGSFKAEWAEFFRGKKVRLVLDNDVAGRKGMAKIARLLHKVAASVEIVKWPDDFRVKGDVEDWLNAGHRLEDLAFDVYKSEPENYVLDIGPYKVIDGATYWVKPIVRQGEVSDYDNIRLCNFAAHIVEEVERDNGVEVSRLFGIEGELENGRKLPRIEVGASEFGPMNWPVAKWGACARLSAGMSAKDRLRDAIQCLSINSGIDARTIYTHTGWRQTQNGWIYLHAGGAIGGKAVEVDLEDALSRYVLPEPENVADAVKLSLSLLDVAPRSVTYPLLCAVALAPLCEILRPDFALWLFGITGAMKTTLASLFLSHFGNFPDKNALPGSWESTGNFLEKVLFTLKDTLAVVDDYAPQIDPSAQRKVERAVSQVVRGAGNLSGRGRMKSDTTLRASYPPRGLMVATGEDVPSTQSILARLLTVEIEQGAVDKARLSIAQEKAHRLPHAMAAYIQWLAPKMDTLGDELKNAWRQRRSEASVDAPHLRVPEQVAYLATGFDTYLAFALEVGAISEDQADRMYQDAWDILLSVAQIHGRRVVEVDPAERFLSVLSSLFASESVYVDLKDMQRHPEDYKPSGDMIGWGDEEFLYLIPDATRAAIATALRAAGDHWPHSQNALYRALDKKGVLVKFGNRYAWPFGLFVTLALWSILLQVVLAWIGVFLWRKKRPSSH